MNTDLAMFSITEVDFNQSAKKKLIPIKNRGSQMTSLLTATDRVSSFNVPQTAQSSSVMQARFNKTP